MNQENTLSEWLSFIENSHPAEIDMSLERIKQVAENLEIDLSESSVVTVGGTNGKGTTCKFIENTCVKAGFSVGVYSSPHILSFCERIRINGNVIEQQSLCHMFYKIECARQGVSLTYFEFTTLAALLFFTQSRLDIVILEVGLGGRLDAVNIIEPNIAVITSIGLDHQDWLGDTKEQIAFEKAGIFRPSIPIIIGEPKAPSSMQKLAKNNSERVLTFGIDFYFDAHTGFAHINNVKFDLSRAKIPKQNIATALVALSEISRIRNLEYPFILELATINALIEETELVGRHQIIQHRRLNQCPEIIIDVAHNQESCELLRSMIEENLIGRLHIVVGMLKDKNISVSLAAFSNMDINWYCASLSGPRGASFSQLVSAVDAVDSGVHNKMVYGFENVEIAYQSALASAEAQDTILITGSFLTVSAVLSSVYDA